MDVFKQVKEAICKVQPGIDEKSIALDASLQDDLEIDSLARVELALALEDAFGFYLQDEELESVAAVSDIVSLIESKLKTKDA